MKGLLLHVHVIDVDRQAGVKMSNFMKCQVKMKTYPEELLKLAFEMVCLVHPFWSSQQAWSSER